MTKKSALLLVWLLILVPSSATAQQPPAFQPDEFLKGMFRLSPQQRRQLRRVEVPLQQEREYGKQVLDGFREQLRLGGIGISDRGDDARYVGALVERLRPMMTNHRRYPKLNVYIVDSLQIDARSIPGGHLVFFRGLLDFADSEAALVGIVAHELSHLDRRHQLKPLQQQLLARRQMAAAQPLEMGRFFEQGRMMLNSFHPFHPEEEEEADEDAVAWMYRAGYDPRELARLFRRLAERGDGPQAAMPAFMRTHPLFPDRAAKVLQLDQRLRRTEPRAALVIGRQALAGRTPAVIGDGVGAAPGRRGGR